MSAIDDLYEQIRQCTLDEATLEIGDLTRFAAIAAEKSDLWNRLTAAALATGTAAPWALDAAMCTAIYYDDVARRIRRTAQIVS